MTTEIVPRRGTLSSMRPSPPVPPRVPQQAIEYLAFARFERPLGFDEMQYSAAAIRPMSGSLRGGS